MDFRMGLKETFKLFGCSHTDEIGRSKHSEVLFVSHNWRELPYRGAVNTKTFKNPYHHSFKARDLYVLTKQVEQRCIPDVRL
jgi:hypothetical protein